MNLGVGSRVCLLGIGLPSISRNSTHSTHVVYSSKTGDVASISGQCLGTKQLGLVGLVAWLEQWGAYPNSDRGLNKFLAGMKREGSSISPSDRKWRAGVAHKT